MSKHQPTIVQFCGHDEGAEGLALENNSGQMQLVSASALARLFKLFPQVECVVLNACYSEVQAEAIHQHIYYVIGINKAIGDKAAVRFSVGFYDALFSGKSYEDCFHMGSTSINLQGIPEHLTPVIRIRQPLKEEKLTSTPIPSNQGNTKEIKVATKINLRRNANIKNTSDSEIDDIVNDVDDKVNFSIPIVNFVSTIFNSIVTSHTLSKNLRPGRIAFNAPRRMVLNRTKLIEVKITDDFNKELKIEAEKQEDIVSEKINIYDYMEAELTGINFEIKSLHKQKQIIPKGEITTWRWSVIPTRLGKQKLYLNIYARFQAGLSEESYNLRTFEYTIYVQVGLWDWIKANWLRLLIWGIAGIRAKWDTL